MRIVLRRALLACAFVSSLSAQAEVGSGSVPYNGGATEDFNGLANSGTSATLPTGWYFHAAATTTYTANDGSASTVGSIYSYGSNAATDRAFGSMATNALGSSGSVVARVGARIHNLSGNSLSQIDVSYVGEVWQYQATTPDKLAFEYSTNATSLTDAAAIWVAVPALDFNVPNTVTGAGMKDGNLAANRAAVFATITGLSVGNGAHFWVRWNDTNVSNVDNGLAIDEVQFGTPVDNPPTLIGTNPIDGATGVAVSANVIMTFSENVTTSGPWFTLNCQNGPEPNPIGGNFIGFGSTRTFDPAVDLPYGTTCYAAISTGYVLDTDGTPDQMTGLNYFQFTTVADVAPSVGSTVPADTATSVLVNSNLSITFSEPVTPTTSNWLVLTCAGSGAHTVLISGGPQVWTANPDSDFGFSESCTATIAATAVEDQDGLPTSMAAPYAWTFTTGADLAPTIVGTFPAGGAVNVAIGTNLTVMFSEPVSTQAGAFAIACDATAQPFAQSSADQITFTLDPNDDLAADSECTLTIDAAFIQDMDGTFNALADGAIVTFTTSAGIAGYYERVDTTSCRAMRATLHGVIDDHFSVSYSPGVWDVLEIADQDPAEPGKILDAYHNKKYTKISDRSGGQDNDHYNREHTWPNSLGFPGTTGDLGLPNAPYTDTHMLYLTDSLHNLHRSNSPYRDCNGGCTGTDATEANYGVGGGGDDNRYTSSQYEVWSKRKGDLARAVLYMDFRYEGGRHAGTGQGEPDLVLAYGSDAGTPGNLTTLLAWHNADPPSNPMSSAPLDNIEVLRNDVIQNVQGNRNPLIDHPEWAAMIFASPCPGPVVVAVDDDYTMAENTTLVRPTIAPLPNTDPGRTLPSLLINDHNGASKNGQGLTATLVMQAQHGTATITDGAIGSFSYVPQNGFCGADEFTYQVSNGSVSDQAIVHIIVTGAVCAPTLPDELFENSFD